MTDIISYLPSQKNVGYFLEAGIILPLTGMKTPTMVTFCDHTSTIFRVFSTGIRVPADGICIGEMDLLRQQSWEQSSWGEW